MNSSSFPQKISSNQTVPYEKLSVRTRVFLLFSSLVTYDRLFYLTIAAVFFAAATICSDVALQSVLASICASFVFVYTSRTIDKCAEQLRHAEFICLFGEDALHNGMHLVYPDFVLNEQAREHLSLLNPQTIFQKDPNNFCHKYRVDINRIVADNDLKALVYLTGFFGKQCKNAPPVIVDSEAVANPEISFISIGLSSNECTHMYLKTRAQAAGFSIVPDENGSEYLQIQSNDGTNEIFKSVPNDTYYGLIVKIKPAPRECPERTWILCAGMGTRGTTGAAWYLANHWKQLHARVGSQDFIAVLRTMSHSDKETKPVKIVLLDKPSYDNE
jgi:hypothetical protein